MAKLNIKNLEYRLESINNKLLQENFKSERVRLLALKAEILSLLNNDNFALIVIDQAIDLDEKNAENYLIKLHILTKIGDHSDKIEVINKLLSLEDNDHYKFLKIQYLIEMQDYNAAIKILQNIDFNKNDLMIDAIKTYVMQQNYKQDDHFFKFENNNVELISKTSQDYENIKEKYTDLAQMMQAV